jgi:hypothetical protein
MDEREGRAYHLVRVGTETMGNAAHERGFPGSHETVKSQDFTSHDGLADGLP